MTYEEKYKIDKLREQGYGCTAISNRLGISLNAVKSYCRRNKLIIKEKRDCCEFCGEILFHKQGSRKKRFCSDKCRISWWNHHRNELNHKVTFEIQCKFCGKIFVSYSSERKYCSQGCFGKSRRKE